MTCRTILRRVIPPVGGAWIPYTAAQVAARRAAQMVVIVVCTLAPSPATAPQPWPDAPVWQPVELVPRPDWHAAAVDVPEPGTAALLAAAVALLAWRRG